MGRGRNTDSLLYGELPGLRVHAPKSETKSESQLMRAVVFGGGLDLSANRALAEYWIDSLEEGLPAELAEGRVQWSSQLQLEIKTELAGISGLTLASRLGRIDPLAVAWEYCDRELWGDWVDAYRQDPATYLSAGQIDLVLRGPDPGTGTVSLRRALIEGFSDEAKSQARRLWHHLDLLPPGFEVIEVGEKLHVRISGTHAALCRRTGANGGSLSGGTKAQAVDWTRRRLRCSRCRRSLRSYQCLDSEPRAEFLSSVEHSLSRTNALERRLIRAGEIERWSEAVIGSAVTRALCTYLNARDGYHLPSGTVDIKEVIGGDPDAIAKLKEEISARS